MRALSVLGVFLAGYHWLVPFGWIGVLVFYVLSGFLITRILLEEREAAYATPNRCPGSFFGRFYFRRTLRIFPLYFLYLLALELTHAFTGVPAAWGEVRPFAFFYAINIGMVTGDVGSSDAYGHLWTLSVEEQFYLLWPIVVWLASRVMLQRLAVALVVLGPLIRYTSSELLGLGIDQIYYSSLSHLDAFAVGAVLAAWDARCIRKALPASAIAIGLVTAIGFGIARETGTAIRTLGYPEGLWLGFGHIWGYTALNLCAGLVILAAMRGELPWLGTPALAYLGRISYGIYLFQRPIKGIYLEQIESHLLAAIPSRPAVLILGAILCLSLSAGLAALSYKYFELGILRWRDRLYPPLRTARR